MALVSSCAEAKSSRTEFVMGTVCTVTLFDRGSDALFDEIFERLRSIEATLSANRDGTNIAEINAAAGLHPVAAHPDTLAVLEEALSFAQKTDGALDPTIGPLVKAWNIGTDYAAVPTAEKMDAARRLVDWRAAIIDRTHGTVFLQRTGMKLDLGAIAKGYAADEIARILKERKIPRALIDLGGNIIAYGKKAGGKDWVIGIRDPETSAGEPVISIPVHDASVVTSGIYERFFEADGKKYHHILDRRTGYPVENELLSVTIITSPSIRADALSTSVFALGPIKGKSLVEGLTGTGAIFIFKDRHIETAGDSVPPITLLTDRFTITR
jgi:thiamine biosynthesis lipoprotein